MTLSTEVIKSGPYTGNGSTVIFDYNFRILLSSDLVVTKTTISTGVEVTLTETTDYSVSGVGDSAGGNVTTVATPTSDEKIFIYSSTPGTQTTDFTNQGAFFPEIHEDQFDRIVRMVQEINDQLGRQVTLAIDSSVSDLTLPDPQAGYHLIWNAGLTGLENALFASSVAFTLNSYWEDVLDDGTLAASLASMLFSSDMQAFLVAATDAAARAALDAPGLTVNNALTGKQTITDTTESTSVSTGSVNTTGGLGVAKTITVGTGILIGGTDAANLLADYEEAGTFTPTVIGSSGGEATYGTPRTGFYTKIGNVVTISLHVKLATEGTISGSVQISALPFAEGSNGNGASVVVGFGDSLTITQFSSLSGRVQGTIISLNIWDATTGISALTLSDIDGTSHFELSATYYV